MLYPQYGRSTYMNEAELQNARALYAGNITLVDRWVGYFFDMVERLGLFKNTMIIWLSDHGHLFGEHNLQGKPGAELGRLYEVTTRIPLMVAYPNGSGQRVSGLVQPPDILPSVLDFLDIPIPSQVQGKSFWPLVTGQQNELREYAFTSRFPPTAGDASYTPVEGATFDGWVGSDRVVEASTITNNEWAYICAPKGMVSELYNLKSDPQQTQNVIKQHPDVAQKMHNAWLSFLKEHGASEARIRPFVDANVEVHTPANGKLFAFRDDRGQWIAAATAREAHALAHREDAPGPKRQVEEITFGALLADNPRNLISLYGQYYWAEDLA